MRTPKWEDLDDLLDLINSLAEERVVMTRKVSLEEEREWLSKALSSLGESEAFHLVAEVGDKLVATSEIDRGQSVYERHVGGIGIAIRDGFRDIGIGTEMMKILIEQARIMGLKVLTLSAFANNKSAIHIYEKVGFKQTGRIPQKFFKDGKYTDEIIMIMLLE
ncbi:MAG: GNAT family N-acetyltransferase [Candidatus Bathyarchaeota archaeon]|nr:GNAT family N-acetyltransferase [Candidatus Bathyarchaeota archaeon]